VLVRKPSSFTRRSTGREQEKEEKKLYRLYSLCSAVNYTAKREFHPSTGHNGPEGELMYRFPLPLTSALYGHG